MHMVFLISLKKAYFDEKQININIKLDIKDM